MSMHQHDRDPGQFLVQCPRCTCWGPANAFCPDCDWHYPENPDIQPRPDARDQIKQQESGNLFRSGIHLITAMTAAGCFGVAEGLMYNRTGGAYGGSIALVFIALIAIGYVGQIMSWVLKWALPIRLSCPQCDYDLSLMDGQLRGGDECPGCDATLV